MPHRRTSAVPEGCHPLLVTDDPDLLDDVVGIAERSGVSLDVATDPTAARPRYPSAPLVLVGAGVARACARAHLPRRPGVVLVSREDADEPPWPAAEAIGAEHVALLPGAAPWIADRILGAADPSPGAHAPLIAVLGGRGGAGASVLAAGLAVTSARRGVQALLVDADPLGGGVDLVLGWEHIDGVRWPDLSQTAGPVSAPALGRALPSRGALTVLSCDRDESTEVSVEAMASALDAGRMGNQLVVVDLPRHFGPAATLVLDEVDLTLLVVPAELRACAAAARIAAQAARHTSTLSLVVRGPAPGRLRAREISKALGISMIGMIRTEPDLARGLERGQPPAGQGRGSLAVLCDRILSDLGLVDRSVS